MNHAIELFHPLYQKADHSKVTEKNHNMELLLIRVTASQLGYKAINPMVHHWMHLFNPYLMKQYIKQEI